ncbi:MAG: hypothetical protein PHC89_01250 [Candidatus Pacebacteria bacterium]|nr:hypothetical protein [Candidatus Paceibacterota bacterium]
MDNSSEKSKQHQYSFQTKLPEGQLVNLDITTPDKDTPIGISIEQRKGSETLAEQITIQITINQQRIEKLESSVQPDKEEKIKKLKRNNKGLENVFQKAKAKVQSSQGQKPKAQASQSTGESTAKSPEVKVNKTEEPKASVRKETPQQQESEKNEKSFGEILEETNAEEAERQKAAQTETQTTSEAVGQKPEEEKPALTTETQKKETISSEQEKSILEARRFGHKKHLFEGFTEKENQKRREYRELQKIFSKKYDDLNENEKKLVRTIDFDKYFKEKNLKQGSREKVTLKKEAIEILDKRIRKLEDTLMKEEGKNFFQRGWRQFKSWYEKPENKAKLSRRIIVSGGVTGLLALTGVGAAGLIGSNLIRFAGSYAGGETARWIYDKNKKDYRERMADFRKENPVPTKFTASEKGIFLNKQFDEYKKRRDELMAGSAKYIQTKNRNRKRWDTFGRLLGGFSVRGLEHLADAAVIPEDAAETITPPPLPVPDPETVPVEIDAITNDAMVRKGEGITHVILRQLKNDPSLRDAFGIDGDPTGVDAARIAKDFGYIHDDGSEIRVFDGQGAAYQLGVDKEGHNFIKEFKGGEMVNGSYEGGSFVERHEGGSLFEGSDKDDYEYLYRKNSSTPTTSSLDNNNIGTDTLGRGGSSVKDPFSVVEENHIPPKVQPLPDHLKTPLQGVNEDNFFGVNEESVLNSSEINNVEGNNRVLLSQEAGPFQIFHDAEGGEIRVNENFEYKGDVDDTKFSRIALHQMKEGRFTLHMNISDERLGPYNGARIAQLKNGRYVFEMTGYGSSEASAQQVALQKAQDVLGAFKMPISDQFFQSFVKEGTTLSKVSIPISENQAAFIGKTYGELARALGTRGLDQ